MGLCEYKNQTGRTERFKPRQHQRSVIPVQTSQKSTEPNITREDHLKGPHLGLRATTDRQPL